MQGQLATGEGAGQRVRRLLCDGAEAVRRASLCFAARGFSLHAATRIDDDEQLTFRLKTPWSDGTTHLLLSPLELIEKLAALVPPRRLNLIRYHGVLAPNASAGNQIVPAPLLEATSIEPTAAVSAQARYASPNMGGSSRQDF